jgi:TPR repeat protein
VIRLLQTFAFCAFVLGVPTTLFTAASMAATTPVAAAAKAPSVDAMALLMAGRYAELDGYLAKLQQSYERGSIRCEDVRDAFRAFYVLLPDQELHYDEWIKLFPKSYVARLARGIHYRFVGLKRRGNEFISKTTDEQLAGMDTAFQDAVRDLSASMELTAKPIISYLQAIDIGKHYGLKRFNRAMLDEANSIDPRNYMVRAKYMSTLQTRWGGSPQQMLDFAKECSKARLTAAQKRTLQAQALDDTAWEYKIEKNYAAAEKAYTAALRVQPDNTDFLLARAWQILLQGNARCVEVIADITRAIPALTEPKDITWARSRRAVCYFNTGRQVDALADYSVAAEMGDPFLQRALGSYYWNGLPGVKPDRAVALEWLRKAAEGGNEQARTEYAYALKEMKRDATQ